MPAKPQQHPVSQQKIQSNWWCEGVSSGEKLHSLLLCVCLLHQCNPQISLCTAGYVQLQECAHYFLRSTLICSSKMLLHLKL